MKARLTLKVRAGARQTQFAGRYGDGSSSTWKLHVSAPPVDGKANEAIVRFLAKFAGVPAAAVRIVTGFTGTTKIIEIEGIDPELLERAILDTHGHPTNTRGIAPPKA
jgi:uncharacterized protein